MLINIDKMRSQSKQGVPSNSKPDSDLLEAVIRELDQKHQCQKALLEANKKFQIKQYNIMNLSTKKVLDLYQNLKNKFYAEAENEATNDQWYDNQLRVFIWLFVCYCYVYKKHFEDITKKDWLDFSLVFNGKIPYLFQYQAKIIKKTNRKSKKWTLEEDNCLNSIIRYFTTLLRPNQSYKWSEVAKRLFIESNKKYFRTPKQCRQRWMNHLDPQKVKSKWTSAQDCALIGHVIKEGKKWAWIAKLMANTRTQHMVKNRFNSLLRAELKKHEEMTDEMRIIKRLHYRLKYALQNKIFEKESKQSDSKDKIPKVEEEIQGQTLSGENGYLNIEKLQPEIEALDDIIESLKGQGVNKPLNVTYKDFDQQNINNEHQQLICFNFEPNYPDFL